MIVRSILFCFAMVMAMNLQAQSLEEQVSAYLDEFLAKHKATISAKELSNTQWATSDLMGASKISFVSSNRFKKQAKGFQASIDKTGGSWYIFNEYVVLEVKKEKTPLYVLKHGNDLVLVDDDQIDVLKQMLIDASYKDGELKSYSYSEIFTFLNGFTLQSK